MARTASTMLTLGTKARIFALSDGIHKEKVNFDRDLSYRGNLILFICNHCPFVIHVKEELSKIGKDYAKKGIRIIAINSNDIENYPEDSPQKMQLFAKENEFTFPYLFDESQDVAKSFSAACTPDFFLFNTELELVYRGQLDDSRPENKIPVTGKDLRNAMDLLLAKEPIPTQQKASIGCNIKWK